MDFGATTKTVTNKDSIFLLTSPLTELTLYSTTDPAGKVLTARLHHFSAARPGSGSNARLDLCTWAASLLLGTNNLSIGELELMAARSEPGVGLLLSRLSAVV